MLPDQIGRHNNRECDFTWQKFESRFFNACVGCLALRRGDELLWGVCGGMWGYVGVYVGPLHVEQSLTGIAFLTPDQPNLVLSITQLFLVIVGLGATPSGFLKGRYINS